jgi:hypothetical protein
MCVKIVGMGLRIRRIRAPVLHVAGHSQTRQCRRTNSVDTGHLIASLVPSVTPEFLGRNRHDEVVFCASDTYCSLLSK